jgi:molybdopterin molybdotransferase
VVPRRPRAAFLSTGDEIVPVEAEPAPGQIRNSNALVAAAQLALAGAVLEESRIVPDTLEGTRAEIARVLDRDLVILSGGVSVGRYDFVARALREEGVEIRFHQVALKPGKPVLFGTRGSTLVFGLPGNPVSSLVTFLLFVAPAIGGMLGHPDPAPRRHRARLASRGLPRRDRSQFLPAVLRRGDDGRLSVDPIGWHGSGHLASMVAATGLLVVPVGEGMVEVGAEVEVVLDDRQLGAIGRSIPPSPPEISR